MQIFKSVFLLSFFIAPLFGMVIPKSISFEPKLEINDAFTIEEVKFNQETLIVKYREKLSIQGYSNFIEFGLYKKTNDQLIELGSFYGMRYLNKNEIHIYSLRIHNEENRGKKYGSFLINFAAKKYESDLKKYKVGWLVLTGDPISLKQSITFCQKFGGQLIKKPTPLVGTRMELNYKQFKAKAKL